MGLPGSLSLIVKTSSACNMACRYCDADIYSHQRMSFGVLAQLTKKALQSHRTVNFIWHGGEPLLLGKDFYRKAVWLQQRYRRPDQHLTNTLQTNGTLLDEEWLDLFDAGGFSIGLSIDGPALLHDRNRILRSQHGTFDRVMHALSLLRKRSRGFGVLAVVTDDTIRLGAREFFRFFVDNGLKNFALLCRRPALNVGQADYVPRSEHSRFVREVFDLWLAEDDPDICIRDFDSIVRALLGGRHSTCLLAGGCIGAYFAVDMIGDVYHCDEFMFDPEYRLGNITVHDLWQPVMSVKIQALSQRNAEEIERLDCPWLPICNGGCPKDRYVERSFAREGKVRCCGFADLIAHISSRIGATRGLTHGNLPGLVSRPAP